MKLSNLKFNLMIFVTLLASIVANAQVSGGAIDKSNCPHCNEVNPSPPPSPPAPPSPTPMPRLIPQFPNAVGMKISNPDTSGNINWAKGDLKNVRWLKEDVTHFSHPEKNYQRIVANFSGDKTELETLSFVRVKKNYCPTCNEVNPSPPPSPPVFPNPSSPMPILTPSASNSNIGEMNF